MTWRRVTNRIRCSVCGRGDWCTFTTEVACCMRVESDRPVRNGGWLHPIGDVPVHLLTTPTIQTPSIDVVAMMREFRLCMTHRLLTTCATTLGITNESLSNLGTGWCTTSQAMAFPMYNERRIPVGIRLRSLRGEKWSVSGSRSGMFIPMVQNESDTLLVTEGPTDTCTAMDMGYMVVGRSSCVGSSATITTLLSSVKGGSGS
jgi:hypothetical protein